MLRVLSQSLTKKTFNNKISLQLKNSIFFSFSSEVTKQVPYSKSASDQYLIFPTKFPIFPYYVYNTRIHKHMYEYITKNDIRYVTAFALKPGVAKKRLYPFSLQHLQAQLNLKPTVPVKKSSLTVDSIQISNNNIIFDGPTSLGDDVSVNYINDIDQIYPIGSVCRIAASIINEGQYVAHLRSQVRLQINPDDYKNHQGPVMYAWGKKIKNQNVIDIEADFQQLMQLYEKLQKISVLNLPQVSQASATKAIQLLSGYLCTLSYFSSHQLYDLFRLTNLPDKTKLLLKYYREYISTLEKQWTKFTQKNEEAVTQQTHKETIKKVYQHMQGILGYGGQNKYINKIRKKLLEGKYPIHVMKSIQAEIQNIQDLGDGNPEVNRKKNYINLLIDYPFGVKVKQTFDIQKAREILDEDHYGMKKIKQRILEFMAVSKLKGQFKSKVLLLHGPPGVGKTSIVKSIAKCLNRPYGRISLGGQYDTSIMKGHRKTYVGAYPGKIFDTIFKAKAQNPVILLDEIDKIQSRAGGASLQDVVMQILDPVQNYKFKDDFIDLQIDLSNVLFICTANSLQTIFPPLLDRLERIEVTGYTTPQKQEIFKRYIIKSSMTEAGLPQDLQSSINFTQPAVNAMIQGYCKQAGVRNLVRKTSKIFQKMALQYVKNLPFEKIIKPDDLRNYLGLPKFYHSRLFQGKPPKGVMIGLAYNAYGGSIMYIQTSVTNLTKQQSKSLTNEQIEKNDKKTDKEKEQASSGILMVTGNIHDVMKESCQLAFTYAKYICSTFFNNHFLQKNDIHLNFPQIQIGKDGPSAGAAITSTFVSLALNKPMIDEIGMTGQITLSGKVNAIGGVKQKTMGAKREGIRKLIFPEQNRKDVQQLEQQIKKDMTFYFAENYFQVMQIVFGLKVEHGTI